MKMYHPPHIQQIDLDWMSTPEPQCELKMKMYHPPHIQQIDLDWMSTPEPVQKEVNYSGKSNCLVNLTSI